MIQLSTDKGYFTTINCGFDKEYNPLMEYLDYAKRLKSLQVAKGIKTQIELSAWMGFSKSIVSAWMRGEKIPSMDTALKIADMFGVCVEWLLTGKGLKHPDDTPALQHYINVTGLTDDQRALINQMMAQFTPKITENNTTKALTSPDENVGGGGGQEPIQQQQTRDRRVIPEKRPKATERRLSACHQMLKDTFRS